MLEEEVVEKKNRNHSAKAALILSIVFSAGLLVALFSNLNWETFFIQLRKVRYEYLALYVVTIVIGFVLRALRWKYLLPTTQTYSLRSLFDANIIGFGANMVLPLRGGEFVRPWLLSRWEGVSFAPAFASIVTERVFDVLTLLALIGITFVRMDEVPEIVIYGSGALGCLAGGILLVMFFGYLLGDRFVQIVEAIMNRLLGSRLPGFKLWAINFLRGFLEGLRAISSFKALLMVLIYSVALWLLGAFGYQVVLWCFGEVPSWWVGMAVSLLVCLAVAAPSAPGFVGTFQFGCCLALCNIYHYPKEFALAYSILAHVCQVIVLAIGSAILLQLRGLKFSQLRQKKE